MFSGGIGERSKEVRQVIGRKMACLGFEVVDAEKNEKMDTLEGVVVDLGAGRPDGEGVGEGKGKKLLVCRTDEQVSNSSVRCGAVRGADVVSASSSWRWRGSARWRRSFGSKYWTDG